MNVSNLDFDGVKAWYKARYDPLVKKILSHSYSDNTSIETVHFDVQVHQDYIERFCITLTPAIKRSVCSFMDACWGTNVQAAHALHCLARVITDIEWKVQRPFLNDLKLAPEEDEQAWGSSGKGKVIKSVIVDHLRLISERVATSKTNADEIKGDCS